jgi:DnaJ-class molecular chaperone
MKKKKIKCPKCRGSGSVELYGDTDDDDGMDAKCPRCKGKGKIKNPYQ